MNAPNNAISRKKLKNVLGTGYSSLTRPQTQWGWTSSPPHPSAPTSPQSLRTALDTCHRLSKILEPSLIMAECVKFS